MPEIRIRSRNKLRLADPFVWDLVRALTTQSSLAPRSSPSSVVDLTFQQFLRLPNHNFCQSSGVRREEWHFGSRVGQRVRAKGTAREAGKEGKEGLWSRAGKLRRGAAAGKYAGFLPIGAIIAKREGAEKCRGCFVPTLAPVRGQWTWTRYFFFQHKRGPNKTTPWLNELHSC